ncbi:MAG: PIN domain-containing protein [Nitrosopumilus sp.]|nr:PIN domain-containing protein [Nitrosopumilus sp.]MDA7997503.1 PIN domain-containing protein [Nitrosopumilus sp.]
MSHNMHDTDGRSYVDASVLFNWLMSDGTPSNEHASAFIKGVENGRFAVIISDLALNEFAKTIKNTLVKNGDIDPESWTKKISNCMEKIFTLHGDVMIIPLQTSSVKHNFPFSWISSTAYNLMLKYPGRTIQNRSGRHIHRGLSTADTLHVALACALKCSLIVTSDKDFDEVEEISCKRPEEFI